MVLRADPAITTLLDFHYQRHYTAERGQHGKGADRHGKSGADTVLRVPLGTVVRERDSGELLGDLTERRADPRRGQAARAAVAATRASPRRRTGPPAAPTSAGPARSAGSRWSSSSSPTWA